MCNADEGDPGAFMDRSLLEGDPHAVLEGMLIAAYAIGAAEGYIYVRAEYPLAIERPGKGHRATCSAAVCWAGRSWAAGSGFEVTIKQGAGAFVCGEETALMASIQGERGMPRPRPPFPAQSGLWGEPTTINNVETLGNVSAILQRGADWYCALRHRGQQGDQDLFAGGQDPPYRPDRSPLGITLGEIIEGIGGGAPEGQGT